MAKSKPSNTSSGKDSTSKPVVTKVSKGKGFIAGTNFPIRSAHNAKNGIFWLEERRTRVSNRYLQGWTQWEIARAEGVDQAIVQTDLEHIRKNWREDTLQSFDEHKNQQLAKIDRIERLAFRAYLKSIGTERVVTREESTGGVSGESSKMKIVKRVLNGDTRYMDQLRWCVEMRCKILGITKDVKNVNVGLLSLNWEDISTDNGADAINNQILELEAHTSNKENKDGK